MNLVLRGIAIALLLFSCEANEYKRTDNIDYLNEVNDWHKKRIENLKKENGWLNLAGLFWLKEGVNTFGTDESNDLVFPANKSAKYFGKIVKQDSSIITYINDDVNVLHNDSLIKKIEMFSDLTNNPTILSYQTLRWFVIKRGDKYGIRLRDLTADLVSDFKGIERFPVQDKWKIEAKFVKNNPPKKIMIPSIIGTVSESYSPGTLEFEFDNKEFRLSPIKSGNRLFIVFADLTSGEETYGAGRFLYTNGPDSNNIVILDFNKAYNPPCAFSKYATCPLPPDENKLKVRISAGEKNYSEMH